MGKGGVFFVGALMGFAAGVFLAPKTGAENREDAKEFARSVLGQGQEYYKQGSERFQSSVSSFRPAGEQGDQLQAKIDAARKIISEQVAKNAAAAKETIEEKAEEVVETVEEIVEEVVEEAEEAAE